MIESQHKYLKPITQIMPFTKPSQALRSIFLKQRNLFDYQVILGNATSIIWILIFTTASFVILRIKK